MVTGISRFAYRNTKWAADVSIWGDIRLEQLCGILFRRLYLVDSCRKLGQTYVYISDSFTLSCNSWPFCIARPTCQIAEWVSVGKQAVSLSQQNRTTLRCIHLVAWSFFIWARFTSQIHIDILQIYLFCLIARVIFSSSEQQSRDPYLFLAVSAFKNRMQNGLLYFISSSLSNRPSSLKTSQYELNVSRTNVKAWVFALKRRRLVASCVVVNIPLVVELCYHC